MLGNAVLRRLYMHENDYTVYGTVRTKSGMVALPSELSSRLIEGVDVDDYDSLVGAFADLRPDIVINCVGLVKQHSRSNDVISALTINSMLPHRLAKLSQAIGARFIHISTDCVYNGTKGNYKETDPSDALDLYGKSKYIGEPTADNSVTLRTSIIGHELNGASNSLVDWFLSQRDEVNGFTNAIFSGLPTVELADVIRNHVLENDKLVGLYHVAARPISKYDLLGLIADVYGKQIKINPYSEFCIDRSLDGTNFQKETGYIADDWPALIRRMFKFG